MSGNKNSPLFCICNIEILTSLKAPINYKFFNQFKTSQQIHNRFLIYNTKRRTVPSYYLIYNLINQYSYLHCISEID